MSAGLVVSEIAKRYALGLFDLAKETNSVDQVLTDVDKVLGLLANIPDLRQLLKNPIISSDEVEQVILELLVKLEINGDVSIVCNFVHLVCESKRLAILEQMLRSFILQVKEYQGIVEVEVTSSHELAKTTNELLEEAIKTCGVKQVEFNNNIDPALLGGIVVRTGSYMIDASLRAKLDDLELTMKEV